MSPDDPRYESWMDEYPDLGYTDWTLEKITALEQALDEHHDSCDECIASIRLSPDNDYCPVGESLLGTWASAALEFSWQLDFPR